MNKAIYSTIFFSVLLLGCGSKEPEQAKSYDSLAEAQAAINFESQKIDELIGQIKHTQTDSEKKTLICEVIPKQYDTVMVIMDANKHLMTASDHVIEADMRQMLTDQKAKFLNSHYC